MQIKINCAYFESGGYCTNTSIRRSLFGFGARVCKIYYKPFSDNCEYIKKTPRPNASPPAPKKSY